MEIRKMNKLTAYAGVAVTAVLLSCATSGEKPQGTGGSGVRATLRPDQKVMVVSNGKAVFRRYTELSADARQQIDRAIAIAYEDLMKARAADPSGRLAVEPFQKELWCNAAIIDGALGVGCGISGYWCSVWIHPDQGVTASCGSVD
jgi:hypothetical protein